MAVVNLTIQIYKVTEIKHDSSKAVLNTKKVTTFNKIAERKIATTVLKEINYYVKTYTKNHLKIYHLHNANEIFLYEDHHLA